ncbi:MAG: nuclear transport factor 2 family protein [Chthoniobacterales bacterium]|jgi:SnoaL-like domain
MDPDFAQLANDRYEIADALHRYAFALDHDHPDTLASVLTDDCRFDFGPAAKKIGVEMAVLNGRDAIVQNVLPRIGPLKTSHSVSNIQIEISGDTASLTAYVASQHFVGRNGSASDFALLMNRYDCGLVRTSAADAPDRVRWQFKRITIDNAWFQGNPDVLDASSMSNALRTKRLKRNA